MNRIDTRVDRVCVYRNGALVIRVGQVPPGPFEIADLPLLHAADALRVRPAAGAIGEVRETCRLHPSNADDPRSPRGAKAQVFEARIAEIDRALADVGARLEALLAIEQPQAAVETPTQPDATALAAWHDALDGRIDALRGQRDTLRLERRAVEQRRMAAEQAVDDDRAPPRYLRGVHGTLSGVEGPTRVEVEYFVAAARWVPTYVLELEAGTASLRFDALVAQASGEDWADATVTVHTANLRRQATIPPMTSWRIGPASAARRPDFRPLPTDLESLFADYDAHRPRDATAESPLPALRPPGSGPPKPQAGARRDRAARTSGTPNDSLETAGRGGIDDTHMFRVDEDALMFGAAPPPPAPAPAMMPAPSMAAPPARGAVPTMARRPAPQKQKKRARMIPPGGAGGGGGTMLSGAAPTTPSAIRPPDHLPPRLRFAYTRLAGADEPGRGKLWPVDPISHLQQLVRDHDADAVEALPRAIDALEQAARRLAHTPSPEGTQAPPGDGYPVAYAAQGCHAVPGDGRWHRVPVARRSAPAKVDFRIVPRMAPDVYRFCTVALEGGGPLPAGPLRVHVDGRYRTTGQLDATGAGAPISMNLGVEPAIRLVDRKVRSHQEDKGLMSTTTRVDHRVDMRLRSGLDASAVVRIYDRLPVSRDPDDERLTIELLDETSPLDQRDRGPDGRPLPGGVRWTITLPPRETQTVTLAYRLAFPAKLEIAGGNRRE